MRLESSTGNESADKKEGEEVSLMGGPDASGEGEEAA